MHYYLKLSVISALYCVSQSNLASAQEPTGVEIVPQIGHSIAADSIALSRDGNWLVSGGQSDPLKFWNFRTGTLLRNYYGDVRGVLSVALSPDNKKLLSGNSDNTMKLWDAESGKLLLSMAHPSQFGMVSSVAYAPDGRHVASGSFDGKVRLWDASSGAMRRVLTGHQWPINSVKFSPAGDRIATASDDKSVILWSAATGQSLRAFVGHTQPVNSVAFSPDGVWLASGSADGTLKIWNTNTGRLSKSFESKVALPPSRVFTEERRRKIYAVDFSPDGTTVLAGHDEWINVWSLSSGTLVQTILDPGRMSTRLFTREGTGIISGADTIRVLDASDGAVTRTLDATSSLDATALFSKDGTRAYALTSNKRLRVWDLVFGRLLRTFDGDVTGTILALSPDGRHLAVSDVDDTAKIWHVETGNVVRVLKGHSGSQGYSGGFASLAFSPDGRTIVSGGYDKSILIWDTDSGQPLRSIEVHGQGKQHYHLTKVAFSPDGNSVLAGGYKFLRLFEAKTGKLLRVFPDQSGDIRSAVFSADGTRIYTGSDDGKVKVWSVSTGAMARTLDGHKEAVTSLAASGDGGHLASASSDGYLRIWSTRDWAPIMTVRGHSAGIRTVTFSRDSKRLLTGGRDGAVSVWDRATIQPLITLSQSQIGEWLAMTPDGFLTGSRPDPGILAVVRGVDAVTIAQVHQSLYNPDLVHEALSGDPNKEVANAAKVINLAKVLASGPAPTVEIVPPQDGASTSREIMTVEAKVTGREGKGVGRIEWRVNGVTAGVLNQPAGTRPEAIVRRDLVLRPGRNDIEIVAYNGSNLLASIAARMSVTYMGASEATKPRLHVLSIGVDSYTDAHFQKLNFARSDADAFAKLMNRIGRDTERYAGEPNIVTLSETSATRQGIEKAIGAIAKSMHPRDTFILFAAAHGTAQNGRFYLIPHDFRSGPDALEYTAIGQTQLQEWLANSITAQRVLVLLDTCASGALVAGADRSRVDVPASEAAVGRLHEATGRPVLTAAATGKAAAEGYRAPDGRRYGVFTYAVLEAFQQGDTNNDGAIDLLELAAHVQRRVPELATAIGAVASGRAAVTWSTNTAVQTASAPAFMQSARLGSRGDNFVLGAKVN